MELFSWVQTSGYFLEFLLLILILLKKIWWLIIPIVLITIYYSWLISKRFKFLDSTKYVYLAITVSPESEKNPSSMEQVLAGFYGIEHEPNFVEHYIEGHVQETLSLEIIGINGNARFLIRTPEHFRDLVEANIYAQYPEAEIIEVEDYTKFAPDHFPSDKYEMFGTDMTLVKKDAYPIRTYYAFADEIEPKEYIDPVATLTESLSKLSDGEQVWIQFIIRPAREGWVEEGERVVAKLIGKEVEEKERLLDKPFKSTVGILHKTLGFLESMLGFAGEEGSVEKHEAPPSLIQFLSPGKQEVVKAIEKNISKVAFEVKFRFIYIARREVFNKPKGISSIFGSINLFNTRDLNGFKPAKKTKTKVDYFKFRIPRRQRKIMRHYKLRRMEQGVNPFVFNIEELATVFHFPYTSVKAPTIVRPEVKTKEPPSDLPVE